MSGSTFFVVLYFMLIAAIPAYSRQGAISTSFNLCRLRRGFTVAKVEPWDANLTYGCELTSDSDTKYHFFTVFKSASEDGVINVLLTRGDRKAKPHLQLHLISYDDRTSWRLMADRHLTLDVLYLNTLTSNRYSSLHIDSDTVSVEYVARKNGIYRGFNADRKYVEIGLPKTINPVRSLERSGILRSFTAVYSASNVTLPVFVLEAQPYHVTDSTTAPVTTTPEMSAISDKATYSSGHSTLGNSVGSILNSSNSSTVTNSSILYGSLADDGDVSVALTTSLAVVGAIVVVFVVGITVLQITRHRQPSPTALDDQLSSHRKDDLVAKVKKLLPDVVIVCRSRLTLGSLLGQGHFALVYDGSCTMAAISAHDPGSSCSGISSKPYSGKTYRMRVAVKCLRESVNILESEHLTEFLSEYTSMQNLDHPNVLRLVGVCVDHEDIDGPLILSPFMANGNLQSYLSQKLLNCNRDDYHNPVRAEELMSYVIQICSGMEYLVSCSIIHRGLAARNCVLDDEKRVKIADFGMARFMNEEDYYDQRGDLPVAVKWMAPESVVQKHFSEKSDVWSFGVTAWEIFSLGNPPYIDIANADILDYLRSGERLDRPDLCPPDLFEIIASCWMWAAPRRDDFKTLQSKLNVACDRHVGYLVVEGN